MTSSSFLAHLQLLDSALPVGSFAHSFGLESAVDAGEVATAADLETWVRDLLHGRWAPLDAVVVAATFELADAARWNDLWQLATRVHLSTPAARSRDAQVAMGRRLLRLLPELHPGGLELEPLATAVADAACPPVLVLVHAWAARGLVVPLDRAATGWLFACVTAAVNAGLRLMSLGHTDAQAMVARIARDIDPAWRHVRGRSHHEIASSALRADLHAMRQPRLAGRMFMS